jgi:hypothetical protein
MSNIPDLTKINIRTAIKFVKPAINMVCLIFFSILFVFENTGIIISSARPRKTVIAATKTEDIKE